MSRGISEPAAFFQKPEPPGPLAGLWVDKIHAEETDDGARHLSGCDGLLAEKRSHSSQSQGRGRRFGRPPRLAGMDELHLQFHH